LVKVTGIAEPTEMSKATAFRGRFSEKTRPPEPQHDAVTDHTALVRTIAVRVRITAASLNGWIEQHRFTALSAFFVALHLSSSSLRV